MGNLALSGSTIFATSAGDGALVPEVEEIDPSTGAVIARTAADSAGDNAAGPLVVAGSTVWTSDSPFNTSGVGHHDELLRLDARTLAVEQRIDTSGYLSLASGGLWVSTDDSLLLLNPTTGATILRVPAPTNTVFGGPISVDPTGKLLYVPGTDDGYPFVAERSAATGALIGTSRLPGDVIAMSASDDGVWIKVDTGHSSYLALLAAANLSTVAEVGQVSVLGPGGYGAFTISGGLLWIVSQSGTVSCANPVNGQVLASQSIPDPWGVGTSPLVDTGRTVYLATSQGIAVFPVNPLCKAG